jgi:hypothetical protein
MIAPSISPTRSTAGALLAIAGVAAFILVVFAVTECVR